MSAMTQGRTGAGARNRDAGGAVASLTGRNGAARGNGADYGADALTGERTPLTRGTSGGRGEVLRLAYPEQPRRRFGWAAREDGGKGVLLALAVFGAIFAVALLLGCDAGALHHNCPADGQAAARGE